MNPIFQKMNFKGQATVYVLSAPETFASVLDEMRTVTEVKSTLGRARGVEFALCFATKQSEVDRFADQVAKASIGDAVVWVAYPKGSSKRYKCEFNRDTGWERMGANGFEPVRQVAIDEDWSALRFRRVEHIQKMTRSFAMTDAGKEKVRKNRTE